MSNGKTVVSGVGGRYATALFELAREAGSLDALEKDIGTLQGLMTESDDFVRLIRSPVFSREVQATAVAAIAKKAKLGDLTARTLGLMAQNRRLFVLADVVRGVRALIADHKGEVTAEVTAAHDLSDKQLDDLKANLKAAMGRDVQVDLKVDADLLGGLVVKVGSRMIDSSLRTKLQNLQIAMKGA